MEFESVDLSEKGEHLMKGIVADLKDIEPDWQEEEVMKLIGKYRNQNPEFKPPFLIMDLAPPQVVKIKVDGEEYKYSDFVDESNKFVKLVASIPQLVDANNITNPFGHSTVKVNQAVPVYRWFMAANLFLQYKEDPGKVIPFPMEIPPEEGEDQSKAKIVYHMLIVTPQEYTKFSYALKHATSITDDFDEGFYTASKIAYQILHDRGIKQELTHEMVDRIITHIMIGQNKGLLEGILLHNCDPDALRDGEALKTNNVYY